MLHFFKTLRSKTAQRGSTIIELLIAVMVVGLIVTAVASAVTYSIKNTGESRYRQVSTILGQQVVEFVRGEKNRLGITNLGIFNTTGITRDYCFSTLPSDLDTEPTQGQCTQSNVINMAGTNFTRDVSITSGGAGTRTPFDPYYLNIVVTVSWTDGTEIRQIELVQEFKQDSGFLN